MRHLLTGSVLVAGALGLLISGLAWSRTLRDDRVTGPHKVEWRGPDDRPLPTEPYAPCESSLMQGAFVHDRRLIMACSWDDDISGLVWIDPARGVARLEWPATRPVRFRHTRALALRPDGSFGVAFDGTVEAQDALAAGIAGRDGWLVAPMVVHKKAAGEEGDALLLAMAWIGDALELVMTRPLGDDLYGSRRAPEVVRIRQGKPLERVVHPAQMSENHYLVLALPGKRGWTLGLRGPDDTALLADEAGAITARTGAWWGDFGEHHRSDLAALGMLGALLSPDAPIVEPDGTRHPIPAPPVPGFTPLIAFERHLMIGGVLRTKRMWTRSPEQIDVMAQSVDGRTVVTATSPDDEDVQLVGDHPDRLRPTIRNSTSYGFRAGEFLPAPGGFYWVNGEGEYVTLDQELRRIDPLSLVHHLRTRGSVGDFIDEPGHVVGAGWALFGFPIMLALGLLLSWLAYGARPGAPITPPRASPLALTLWAFVVTGGWALFGVLPLL
jgi:hypothetical protein